MSIIGDLFTGGGGGGGYKSKGTKEYEDIARQGIYNRAGIRKISKPKPASISGSRQINPAAVRGRYGQYYDAQGNVVSPYLSAPQSSSKDDYIYDYSNVGKRLSGAEGIKEATSGYDFSPIDDAISGYKKPSLFSQTYKSGYTPQAYNPYQFNFESLPDEYAATEYALGSKDIRREGKGALDEIQKTVGVRRPGLLMKASQKNARDVGEQLAALNSQIRLKQMEQKTALGVDQQRAQAEENYKAAGYSDDQARRLADEQFKEYQSKSGLEDKEFQRLQALESAGKGKIGAQGGILESERAYEDQALQYLIDLYLKSAGIQNDSASLDNQRRGQTLGFFGNLAGAAAGLGGK